MAVLSVREAITLASNVVVDKDEKVFTTPIKIRNMGIVVCACCGVHNSDSLKKCKSCKEQLIYIRDEQH